MENTIDKYKDIIRLLSVNKFITSAVISSVKIRGNECIYIIMYTSGQYKVQITEILSNNCVSSYNSKNKDTYIVSEKIKDCCFIYNQFDFVIRKSIDICTIGSDSIIIEHIK
jgi:hypothetical protein